MSSFPSISYLIMPLLKPVALHIVYRRKKKRKTTVQSHEKWLVQPQLVNYEMVMHPIGSVPNQLTLAKGQLVHKGTWISTSHHPLKLTYESLWPSKHRQHVNCYVTICHDIGLEIDTNSCLERSSTTVTLLAKGVGSVDTVNFVYRLSH